MTLDARLKRAVDTLGDRLREEISRELRMVTDELSAEAGAAREAAVQSAIASISSAIAVTQPSSEEPGEKRLLHAIRALDDARSLTAVLDTLVEHAAAEASRAGVLLVRADRVRRWRDERFDVALAETGIVADAVRTRLARSTTADGTVTPPFAGVALDAELHAFPLSLSGEVVAVLYAEGGTAATLEIVARHAAAVLESLTAFKTARAIGVAPSSVGASAAEVVPVDEQEATARRYAHLLISEIKLYHQDAVEAGRRERDLAVRLGGEITRARSLYGERVPAHVPHAADYFRDELVRTLAAGDASLLADLSAA